MILESAGRIVKTVFIALIAIGFLAFAIDNRQTVSISLFPLPYRADLPEFLLAIACVLLGAIVSGLVASMRMMKLKRDAKVERQRAQALENELKVLQARPNTALPVTKA